ncbi:uncharacterized protein LOC126881317 [Diabrotica virgifera virgifera]|uniref:RNase H type-1 domain-containing protein n=1 Tax=Diabrotica virgifera virgifera TaxID=50390 RepID=A0ABM5JU78_DIAVI|nr:uncharacterized protein LOC126881317 [Diabrotica virgifera virgifera]
MQALTGEPPLHIRRQQLSLNYIAKISSQKQHPVFSHICNPGLPPNKKTKNSTPLIDRIKLTNFDRSQLNVSLNINSNFPPWTNHPLTIDLTLTKYPKLTTNPTIIKHLFMEILDHYPKYLQIFTDASKTPNSHAAAYYSNVNSYSISIPTNCSILTGETTAILEALIFFKQSKTMKCIVITDSLNALLGLKQMYTKNTILQRIKNELETLRALGKEVVFIWVPSHAGIYGNEKADELANKSRMSANHTAKLKTYPCTDLKNLVKVHCTNTWQNHSEKICSKLKEIYTKIDVVLDNPSNRRN